MLISYLCLSKFRKRPDMVNIQYWWHENKCLLILEGIVRWQVPSGSDEMHLWGNEKKTEIRLKSLLTWKLGGGLGLAMWKHSLELDYEGAPDILDTLLLFFSGWLTGFSHLLFLLPRIPARRDGEVKESKQEWPLLNNWRKTWLNMWVSSIWGGSG